MWALRLTATAMQVAGAALLVAGVTLLLLAPADLTRPIAVHSMQIAAAFMAGGAATRFFSRSRRPGLPNEQTALPDTQRPRIGGWLYGLAVTLVAAPVLLLVRLQPHLVEGRRVIDRLATLGIWETANANGSGLILLPLAGAFTPPALELATVMSCIGASLVLLPLLILRHPILVRVYVALTIVIATLAFVSWRGVNVALVAAGALQNAVDASSTTSEEAAQIGNGITRYTSAIRMALPPLLWAMLAYLVWLPPLLMSRRSRATFAARAEHAATSRLDVEAVTSPPPFPG